MDENLTTLTDLKDEMQTVICFLEEAAKQAAKLRKACQNYTAEDQPETAREEMLWQIKNLSSTSGSIVNNLMEKVKVLKIERLLL